MGLLERNQALTGFIAGIVAAGAWVYSTIPSYKYVDDKFAVAISHSDMNRATMEAKIDAQSKAITEGLGQIKDTVKTIQDWIWQLKSFPTQPPVLQPVIQTGSNPTGMKGN